MTTPLDRIITALYAEPPRTLARVLAEIAAADTDYEARYPLVFEAMLLALDHGYPSGIGYDPLEPDYPMVAYIELPTGQLSWHMPPHPLPWDQHSTAEKYARIATYCKEHP